MLVVGGQLGKQFAELSRAQDPLSDLAFLAKAPLALASRRALVRLEYGERSGSPDQVPAVCVRDEGLVILEGVGMQRQERVGEALDVGRPPGEDELAAARQFLAAAGPQGLTDYCLAVFNLNEFAYVD